MNLRGVRFKATFLFAPWLLFMLMSIPLHATVTHFIFTENEEGTAIEFMIDSSVQFQVQEEGLDIVLTFPDVDLTALPHETMLGTTNVASIQVDFDAHQIRIVRTKLYPFEVQQSNEKIVVHIRSAPKEPSQERETHNESEKKAPAQVRPETEEDLVEAHKQVRQEASPETQNNGALLIHDVALDFSQEIPVVHLLGDSGAFEQKQMLLENPKRYVFDLMPARFPKGRKTFPVKDSTLIKEVRIAQYKVNPVPITRIVIEMAEDTEDLQPFLTASAEGINIRLQTSLMADNRIIPQEEEAENQDEEVTEATVPEERVEEKQSENIEKMETFEEVSEPENTGETTDMATNTQPELPSHKTAESEDHSGEKVIEAEGMEWDPSFFSTQELKFYQITDEEKAALEAAEKAKYLPIFQEKQITTQKKYKGEVITLDFTDVHIKDLMVLFSDLSGLNIVLDPSVEGPQYKIPVLRLRFVPWDQALDLVTRMLGLGYILEGNILRVAPVDVLAREAAERRKLSEDVGEIQTIIKPLSYADASEVKALAEQLLTPRGTIFVDKRTNTLIIKEVETNIKNIINLIETLDTRIPQVSIEARIIQTRRNYTQALGIQWGFRGLMSPALGNSTSMVFPNNIAIFGNALVSQTGGISGNPIGGYAVNLPTQQAPSGAILLSLGSVMDTFRLDAAIMALESSGLARVLSSPHVTTQNNKKAEIKSGYQIPVQTIVNNTIQVQYVDATLKLTVTPQITADGSVIMDVKVENRRPDFTRPVLGIPPIITQDATTTLLIKDGHTAVLGGIIQSSEEVSRNAVPMLYKIPILGWLFRNKNVTRDNDELLIFITPRIVK